MVLFGAFRYKDFRGGKAEWAGVCTLERTVSHEDRLGQISGGERAEVGCIGLAFARSKSPHLRIHLD